MIEPTVQVSRDDTWNVIVMQWARIVDIDDVQVAFRLVQAQLDQAMQPTHVVIDMLNNPRFPLLTSINCLVTGPLTHPRMGQWLIIGGGSQARIFAKTITDMNGDSAAVRWFPDERQAAAHLARLAEEAPPLRFTRLGTGQLQSQPGL